MQSYRIAYWLSLIGGVFILLLAYIMDYFESSSSSITFSRSSYGEGILTPFGAKIIGSLLIFLGIGTLLNKKEVLEERARLDDTEYEYLIIRKKEKEALRKLEKKKRQKKRKKKMRK
ncbi:hypothetical protein [Flavobacterium sp.]|uniref:hypothetical protein n=1 Tax=Flavobacterium sp. TaxID=239 RepID=UPI0040478E3E